MKLPRSERGFLSLRRKGKSFAQHYYRTITHPLKKTIDEPHRIFITPGTFGVEVYTDIIEMHYDYFLGKSSTSRTNVERVVAKVEEIYIPPGYTEGSEDLSWYFP
jgi:hypothetical protein|tara:strand:- start:762 stop:1076 length:315 start_codon:yes stop_codon:yes gene_type:complete